MTPFSTKGETTDQTRLLFQLLNDTTVLSNYDIPGRVFSILMESISYGIIVVAFFGMTGNIIIIITFTKMGFSESINISYCALCISDILCIIAFSWNALCFIPAFTDLDLPFIPSEIVIVTGGSAVEIFSETTAWITAFISLERCLCVVFPLKVKDIVRPRRTVFIVVTIFALTILPLASITFYIYVFYSRFDTKTNRTLIGVRLRKSSLANTIFYIHPFFKMVFMNITPLVIVFVCSLSMAVHLNRSAAWRLNQSGSISPDTQDNKAMRKYLKDTRVAKTVLAIATCFMVLESFGALRRLVAATLPEFRLMGAYSRFFKAITRLAFSFSLINSSVNFIIYYKMGKKFRHTVKHMLLSNGQ